MTPRPSIYNSVLERLKDNAAEDTIHMASQMRAMSDGPGWGFLNDLLAQMVERVDQLMEFGLHEQAEYAAMVAERRTLRTPQAVVDAVIEAGRRAEQNLNEMVSQMEAREDHHGG